MKEMWDAPDIVPSIIYADVPRAVEWLVQVFGFRERVEARLTWSSGCMAWLEVGEGLFNVSSHDGTWPQAEGRASSDVVMKVYVDDVDRHFVRAKAAGANIVSEPQDGFWGGRTYRALDPEGHRWEISQRGRDLAAEQWKLPAGLVRGVTALFFAVALAASGVAGAQADAEKELKTLQGSWTLESSVTGGTEVPADQLKGLIVTFEGNTHTLKRGDEVIQVGTLKLDPSKSPRTIDVTMTDGPNKGAVMLGIYEIDGDTLKACFDPQGKQRPTEFKSPPGSANFVNIHKRMKRSD